LKLFLNSEELGDYISKNNKFINTNTKKKKKKKKKQKKKKKKKKKKHLEYDSTIRVIILNEIYKKSIK